MSLGQKLSSFSSSSSLPLPRHQFPSVNIFSIILHGIPNHCHLHLNYWSSSLTLLLEFGFSLSWILSVLQQYSQCHILCPRYVTNALSVSGKPMVFLTFKLLCMLALSFYSHNRLPQTLALKSLLKNWTSKFLQSPSTSHFFSIAMLVSNYYYFMLWCYKQRKYINADAACECICRIMWYT